MNENLCAINEDDFCDDESKLIFRERKLFYENDDWSHLLNIAIKTYNNMMDKLKSASLEYRNKYTEIFKNKNSLVIFGAGINGKKIFNFLKNDCNILAYAFCDNKKINDDICGIPVLTVEEIIKNMYEYTVIIPIGKYTDEMKAQLINRGFSEKSIICFDIDKIVDLNIEHRQDLEEIFLNKNNRFITYGASSYDILTAWLLKRAEIKIEAVCSLSRDGSILKDFDGIPIVPFDKDNGDFKDCYILTQHWNKSLLDEIDIPKNRIILFFNSDHLQYFDNEIIPSPKEKQVFIDAGCFDMGTAIEFINWSKKYCDKIYSFEPDSYNYDICEKVMNENPKLSEKVSLVKKGVWNSDKVLTFNSTSVASASYVKESDCPNADLQNIKTDVVELIECTSIDNVLNGEKATFIKMDVEGSELEALKGAEKTILKYHPILAISIYHKPEDIIEIPHFIKKIVPEYKFYIRCYHTDSTETILYAIYGDKEN